MPMTFVNFLTQINDALGAENGHNLAFLLRPTSPHAKDLLKEYKLNPTREKLSYYKGSIQEPWDEIAIQYVLTCSHVARRRSIEAFKEHSQLVSNFYNFFGQNSGWTLPVLFSILRDLRDLAFDADFHAKYNGLKSDSMEESARIISKAFSLCLTDSPVKDFAARSVAEVGCLLCGRTGPQVLLSGSTYISVKEHSSCPRRESRHTRSEFLSQITPSHLSLLPRNVAFSQRGIPIGKRAMSSMGWPLIQFDAQAEEEFTKAFYQCHIQAQANQERILTYLLPLRLLKGHLPSQDLLDRFPHVRELFSPFVAAIRAGDLTAYDRALDKSGKKLLELNLWMTLEKGREICLRGLFRKVSVLELFRLSPLLTESHSWLASEKGSRIPISMFHAALRVSGVDVESEEAECFLANQIYKGFIRGYISHEKQMVVLANTNAFPKPADRPTPFNSL
ncbi:COP9 signalosome (CSN) subunit [Marasmius crinis-equi]|uniref:COP9 signalosome (CSN) subunit n=1 Tax=Marasmius crinis-equi TaxID=585013 RepID=A0ABR3FPW6_9AGAR